MAVLRIRVGSMSSGPPHVSMSVSVPPSLYAKIEEVQKRRAKEDDEALNRSEVVREALRGYYGIDE